jgi:hypothetical protein
MARDITVSAKLRRRLVPKRELASFCGFAQSVRLAVMPANLLAFRVANLEVDEALLYLLEREAFQRLLLLPQLLLFSWDTGSIVD